MLRVREHTPTPSFIVFIFELTFESFNKCGAVSPTYCQLSKNVIGIHYFLLCLKAKMATLNSQSFNSFPNFHSYFCLIFVKVNILLVLVDLCKIMGVVILALNNGKIGTRKGCKLNFG
jgi:hypothetical protein